MKLLTKEMMLRIPPLYSQENNPDPIVQAKFFTPDSNWTWYVLEGSGKAIIRGEEETFPLDVIRSKTVASLVEDVIFFGLVEGFEDELGYFSLNEIGKATGPYGLHIERDLHWKPKPISQVWPKWEEFMKTQKNELEGGGE